MDRKPSPFKIVDMPAARRDTPNFIDTIWWKHWIYGLIEVDVSVPRKLIKVTEHVIGKMKMHSRTVRGYKSWQGMWAALLLSGSGVAF